LGVAVREVVAAYLVGAIRVLDANPHPVGEAACLAAVDHLAALIAVLLDARLGVLLARRVAGPAAAHRPVAGVVVAAVARSRERDHVLPPYTHQPEANQERHSCLSEFLTT